MAFLVFSINFLIFGLILALPLSLQNKTNYDDILLENCPIGPYVNSPQEADGVTTQVDVYMTVDRFIGIDDVAETFSVGGFVSLGWTVPCVVGVSRKFLPNMSALTRADESAFWWPEALHRNSATLVDIRGYGYTRSLLIVLLNGYFTGVAIGSFTSICGLNLYKFPFDAHNCSVNILLKEMKPFSYVKLGVYSFQNFTDGYMPGGGNWEHTGSSTMVAEGFYGEEVRFIMSFRRRPDYYMVNLFAPSLVLSILELASFLVPADTPDRPAFACTIMLSVFMLRDQMLVNVPKTSQTIIAAYYILGEILYAMACAIYAAGMCSYVTLFPNRANHKLFFCGLFHMPRYCLVDLIAFGIALILLALLNLNVILAIAND